MVRLWEIPSGRSTATFHGHADFVHAGAFQPDGREVVTGGMDGSIRFWNLRTSRPIVIEHNAWVERIAYRRDGLRVLSEDGRYATGSEVAKSWDPLTGELDTAQSGINYAELPAEFVRGSAFFELSKTSPAGDLIAKSLLATGQSARIKDYVKNSVIVVDTGTGQVAHTLNGHSRPVVCLAFSPDGNRLISGGIDSTARVWDATPLASNVTAQQRFGAPGTGRCLPCPQGEAPQGRFILTLGPPTGTGSGP